MQESFIIEVSNLNYHIESYWEENSIYYEVFTNCEKLFTLHKISDGTWITREANIIPISADIFGDIGNAIDLHLTF